TGPASFTFKANDGVADSNVATITITFLVPAGVSASVNGNRLQVDYLTPGRSVLVTTIGTTTTINEQTIGARSFPTTTFNQFSATDLTNSAGSTITFAGTSPLILPGGLTSN